MTSICKAGFGLFVAASLVGCGAQRYHAAPIAPAQTAEKLAARNFSDPALRAFIEKNLGHAVTPWPPKTWNLETLSLAAAYFNPSLEYARARVAESEAAMITAGARPNPTLSLSPGIPSPYLLTLDFTFPLETARKRGHRVDVARNLDQTARLDLADAAWTVRANIRAALVNYLTAQRAADAVHAEEQARQRQIGILEQIVSAGELPSQGLSAARIELAKTRVAIATAEGRVTETKAVLAGALSVPVAALQGIEVAWPGIDALPTMPSLSPSEIQRDAVLNRIDIRRALSVYAAAEASLQLEIAKQYPDISLGPGYTYEERNSFFTVGLSMPVPLFNRNEGPIAEAEARRREAAAALEERQTQAIAVSERARAAYATALKELAALEAVRKMQEGQADALRQSIHAGTETRLSLGTIQIEQSLSARSRLDALLRAQTALGELENAVQRPLSSPEAIARDNSAVSGAVR